MTSSTRAHGPSRGRGGDSNPPRIYRHTRRVQMIGGRDNWRSHKPYRPTVLHSEPVPSWAKLVVLFVLSAMLLPWVMGGWK